MKTLTMTVDQINAVCTILKLEAMTRMGLNVEQFANAHAQMIKTTDKLNVDEKEGWLAALTPEGESPKLGSGFQKGVQMVMLEKLMNTILQNVEVLMGATADFTVAMGNRNLIPNWEDDNRKVDVTLEQEIFDLCCELVWTGAYTVAVNENLDIDVVELFKRNQPELRRMFPRLKDEPEQNAPGGQMLN